MSRFDDMCGGKDGKAPPTTEQYRAVVRAARKWAKARDNFSRGRNDKNLTYVFVRELSATEQDRADELKQALAELEEP